MRAFQIGVMGSAADLNYASDLELLAEELGKAIALSENITIYGAEKDYDSLSTAAARGAKRAGGRTVGITYGKGKNIYDQDSTDIIIVSGAERGGPRESILALSCDAIIAISGGSGTLNELVVAYQANIPMIAMRKTGGWAEKMAGTYFDQRQRRMVLGADSAQQAVTLAIREATEYRRVGGSQ